VRTERTVNVHSYLFSTASEALRHAKEDEKGRFFDCLSCNLFCMLSIEAYLNHIGPKLVPHWERYEMKLSPEDKMVLISDNIGFSPDFSRMPFGRLKDLIKFRNFTVHGKTIREVKEFTQKLGKSKRLTLEKSKWESKCDIKVSQRFIKSTKEMISIIHEKAKLPGFPLANPSSTFYSVREPN
jgi:hypothetical protein